MNNAMKSVNQLLEEFKAKGGVIKKVPVGYRAFCLDLSYDGKLIELETSEYRQGCRHVSRNWVLKGEFEYEDLSAAVSMGEF